jgi:hypothetical protein
LLANFANLHAQNIGQKTNFVDRETLTGGDRLLACRNGTLDSLSQHEQDKSREPVTIDRSIDRTKQNDDD